VRHARGARSSEAALLSAKPAATALGLLRSVERPSVAAAAAAAIVTTTALVAATTVEVTTTGISTAVETVRRGAAEITPLARRTGPILRYIQADLASTDFTSVELLDRLRSMLFSSEADECKPPRAAGFAVLWNVNVNYLADLSKEITQLLVGRGKVEVPYEYLA
jgi:hypothetical protein